MREMSLCYSAAAKGQLAVLQWARQIGCSWDEGTCRTAALHGHLSVLEWARGNGCPWNGRTCINAAWAGHLDVLQWAAWNGCPCDYRACISAARSWLIPGMSPDSLFVGPVIRWCEEVLNGVE